MTVPANIVLEDSYVLGWKFSNYTFHLIGEFRNTDLETNSTTDAFNVKWELGELTFRGITSAKFTELTVVLGKDGELDFGSPDIDFSERGARLELSQGHCELLGGSITVEYISGAPL